MAQPCWSLGGYSNTVPHRGGYPDMVLGENTRILHRGGYPDTPPDGKNMGNVLCGSRKGKNVHQKEGKCWFPKGIFMTLGKRDQEGNDPKNAPRNADWRHWKKYKYANRKGG